MNLPVLVHNEIDPRGLEKPYERALGFLREGNFSGASVKKLKNHNLYRAALDDRNRLLFKYGEYKGSKVILVLELIRNHAYDKSRILQGAKVEEADFDENESEVSPGIQAESLRYLNASTNRFHLLDRILSFDDDQEKIFEALPPLVLIGSAGSGKTALLLEKMKRLSGNILYVTHSPFLVESARNIYFSNSYANEGQEIDFLSFGELVQTIRTPEGRESTYGDFKAWFERGRSGHSFRDPRKLYEEFKGVITGSTPDQSDFSREGYLNLGVKQSILTQAERGEAWDLHARWARYQSESHLYDLNTVAVKYQNLAKAEYDALVVDEVQDFTTPQLALCLKVLKDPGSFILSGDSNQIVHPNFFSWSRVKTYFYLSQVSNPVEIIRILKHNYRNSVLVTELANRLLLLKQKRFGSIDRESNYLVKSRSEDPGSVELLSDSEQIRSEINRKTGRSTRFAVVTLTDAGKEEARKRFSTPLVFSIHEAKGLEYEHVVIYNMITSAEKEFRAVAEGVSASDLEVEAGEAEYSRARDKEDKSGEIYKFYVNAFYVAITRCRQGLYLVEEKPKQSILEILGVKVVRENMSLKSEESSLEDWQKEARRLELQGKEEQAAQIRKQILKIQPVPWEVMDDTKFISLMPSAFDGGRIDKKAQRAVFEYAVAHDWPHVLPKLIEAKYTFAKRPQEGREFIKEKYGQAYKPSLKNQLTQLLRNHGVEHLSPMGDTPLQMAVRAGNVDAVKLLVELGADRGNPGNGGRIPHAMALGLAFENSKYSNTTLPEILPHIGLSFINVRFNAHLRKLDSRHVEYFLVLWVLSKWRSRMGEAISMGYSPAFGNDDLFKAVASLPLSVIPEYRKAKAYLSSALAKNEMLKAGPGNRRLFLRVQRGHYIPNPLLEIQVGLEWKNIYDLTGVDTVCQTVESGKGKWFLGNLKKFREEIQKRFDADVEPGK